MKIQSLAKKVALIMLLVLVVFLTLWAYFQPSFLMDLANKYVFC